MPNVTRCSAILGDVLRLPAALEIAVRQAAGNGTGLLHPLTPAVALQFHRPFLGSVPGGAIPRPVFLRPAFAPPLPRKPQTS